MHAAAVFDHTGLCSRKGIGSDRVVDDLVEFSDAWEFHLFEVPALLCSSADHQELGEEIAGSAVFWPQGLTSLTGRSSQEAVCRS